MDEKEMQEALRKMEERVSTLEIVSRYKEPRRFNVLKFLEQNAEIIAALALFVAFNLVLWERLNYAN